MNKLELKHNIVYLNNNYEYGAGKIKKYDPNEYNAICLRDLENTEGVDIVPFPLANYPTLLRKLYIRHQRWARKYKFPFKKLWYPFIWRNRFKTKKPICFILATPYYPLEYLYYLKKRYPDCKIVEIYRDLLKVRRYSTPDITEDIAQNLFDLRLSLDQNECKKYGFLWFHEIQSVIPLPSLEKYPHCDVFFCGQAKNRLSRIVAAYDKLGNAGLKCHFIVTHASENEKQLRDGIIYTNAFIPYIDMLNMTVNAKCVFDTQQEGYVGFSSRFLEAVMYNKRLITDNPSVLESPFYNTRYIQYVTDMDMIDPDFVTQKEVVNYHYAGEFSPIHLVEQIDKALQQKDSINKK